MINMKKILLTTIIIALGILIWNSNNPFPQFTPEQMEQICIEEGIY